MTMAVLSFEFEKPGWLKTSAYNAVMQRALTDVGKYIVANIVGKHFTAAGAREYGFKPRDPAYEQQKQRRLGHRRPNVGKHRLDQMAKRGARISATAKVLTVRLTGLSRIDAERRRELEAISKRDEEAMAKVLAEGIATRLAKVRPVRVQV